MSITAGARPCLGTAQLGGGYGIARRGAGPDAGEVERILAAAVDNGVRALDTAPAYGAAEERVGAFLRRCGHRDGLEIATKLPALPPGLTAGEVEAAVVHAVEGSRRRLGTDTLDHLLLHRAADLEAHGTALLETLARCRERGWIVQAGISVYEPHEAESALPCRAMSSVQLPFHVLDRRMREQGTVDRLRAAGRTVFARSPLLQGLLAMDPGALPAAVAAAGPWLRVFREVARRHGLAPVPAALAFAARYAGAHWLVLGVDSAAQLREAAEAIRRPLPSGLARDVDDALRDVPEHVRDPRRWAATP